MHGYKEFGLKQAVHNLMLLLAGVTGYVNLFQTFIHDVCPEVV